MTQSTSAGMKFFYDDAVGNPVDITAFVLSINDVDVSNMLQQTDPYGTTMPEFTPTGKGKIEPIEIGGLYKTGAGSIDELFSGRVPEGPTAATRTFSVEYIAGVRKTLVETHLEHFKRSPNKDNGLTRFSVRLQPTGVVTEV
jgi:hypothetical protein